MIATPSKDLIISNIFRVNDVVKFKKLLSDFNPELLKCIKVYYDNKIQFVCCNSPMVKILPPPEIRKKLGINGLKHYIREFNRAMDKRSFAVIFETYDNHTDIILFHPKLNKHPQVIRSPLTIVSLGG
jgi:hypothetical protein